MVVTGESGVQVLVTIDVQVLFTVDIGYWCFSVNLSQVSVTCKADVFLIFLTVVCRTFVRVAHPCGLYPATHSNGLVCPYLGVT